MDCAVGSCGKKAYSRGWCKTHYTRWRRHGDSLVRLTLPPGSEPYDSILKYGVEHVNECLIYRGPTNGTSGYGVTYGKLLAHRVAFEKWIGPIAAGYWVDHICHNQSTCPGGPCLHRRCVNPGHLRAVTPQQNTLASPNTGGKTHCKHGHLYTPENTYVQRQARGHGTARVCRTCKIERSKYVNSRN